MLRQKHARLRMGISDVCGAVDPSPDHVVTCHPRPRGHVPPPTTWSRAKPPNGGRACVHMFGPVRMQGERVQGERVQGERVQGERVQGERVQARLRVLWLCRKQESPGRRITSVAACVWRGREGVPCKKKAKKESKKAQGKKARALCLLVDGLPLV